MNLRTVQLTRFMLGFAGCLALTPAGCAQGEIIESDEEQGVRVRIRGKLVESGDDAGEFGAVRIYVVRTSVNKDAQRISEKITPDTDGSFETESIRLRPWEETYELRIKDSSDVYRSRSLALFSLTTGTLEYGELALTRADTGTYTQVRGQLRDAASGAAVSGASVQLKGDTQSAKTTTDAEGAFEFEGVSVQAYEIFVNAEGVISDDAPAGYIPDSFQLKLHASADNNIGHLLIAPKRHEGEVTLMFIGPKPEDDEDLINQCLAELPGKAEDGSTKGAGHLFLAPRTFNINGAYGLTVERWGEEGLTKPDGFGFGTEFWPAFLGARSGVTGATSAPIGQVYEHVKGSDFAQDLYHAGTPPRVVVDARVFDFSDARVETMTLPKRSPLDASPKNLGYYYQLNDTRHFPVGVGLYSANVKCFERAQLKVYQGDELLGWFELGESTEAQQEGEITEWAPILLEYGFTDTLSEVLSAKELDEALYFNVLPFGTIDLNWQGTLQAYEQPNGVRFPAGAPPGAGGWQPVPDRLSQVTSGGTQAFFIGRSGETHGMWTLDAGNGPVTTKTFIAGEHAFLPEGARLLAVAAAELSIGNDLAALAFESNGEYFVVETRPNASAQPFECGTPTSLAYIDGRLAVGTNSGLQLASCAEASAAEGWLARVVADEQPELADITGLKQLSNELGYPLLLVATAGSGLWLVDPGPQGGWQQVAGIPERATISDWAEHDGQLYVATRSELYVLSGSSALKSTEFRLPSETPSEGDAEPEPLRITSLLSFRGQLLVGTTAGVYSFKPQLAGACDSDGDSKLCSISGVSFMPGVPAMRINGLALVGGRVFALTQRGLLELLAPGTSLAGAVSESASIAGVQALPEGTAQAADPFEGQTQMAQADELGNLGGAAGEPDMQGMLPPQPGDAGVPLNAGSEGQMGGAGGGAGMPSEVAGNTQIGDAGAGGMSSGGAGGMSSGGAGGMSSGGVGGMSSAGAGGMPPRRPLGGAGGGG